jgi:hypothetical protein
MASLSIMAIPVFLDTTPDANHLVRLWSRTYHYGHVILPGICIGACGLYGYAALTQSKRRLSYAVAGLTTIAMVPFTWVFMTPTNNTLFGLEASAVSAPESFAPDLDAVRRLVVRWAWLHIARSVFPLVGSVLGFTTLLQEFGL